jgi:uncharacterized repeat protein (TIGR04076 family)
MFQVKATVVGFLGDISIYPCHFEHKIGDEVIYDGDGYTGRLCPDVWPLIVPKVAALHQAGPRYVEWGSYYPFWYCSASVKDDSRKKYDGLGYQNVLKTIEPPKHDMARLVPPHAFDWPPTGERNIARQASAICPDTRSSMVVMLEAFDLSEKGFDIPYFRRQMVMLDRLLKKPGIPADDLLGLFSQEEIEKIYPPLSPVMVQILAEELDIMGYLEVKDGKASGTEKGVKKVEDFKKKLTAEEREALKV